MKWTRIIDKVPAPDDIVLIATGVEVARGTVSEMFVGSYAGEDGRPDVLGLWYHEDSCTYTYVGPADYWTPITMPYVSVSDVREVRAT